MIPARHARDFMQIAGAFAMQSRLSIGVLSAEGIQGRGNRGRNKGRKNALQCEGSEAKQ
jgi:hypothetical protein